MKRPDILHQMLHISRFEVTQRGHDWDVADVMDTVIDWYQNYEKRTDEPVEP